MSSTLVINCRHCPRCNACWHAGQSCRHQSTPDDDTLRWFVEKVEEERRRRRLEVGRRAELPVPGAQRSYMIYNGQAVPLADLDPDGALTVPVLNLSEGDGHPFADRPDLQ